MILTRTLVLLCLVAGPAAAEGTRLLRYPDLHGDMVVFSYAGDLWRSSIQGGSATRLTAHKGLEVFPKLSPDGRWIAFTGQYDGDEQVYVMPSSGGEPRQLTFYPAMGPLPPRWGYDNQVCGWTPDGSAILFRSHRASFAVNESRLFVVSLAGGLPRALAMPTAGAGAYSPEGTRILYSPLSRDFRAWKGYEGGWAQDLWVFDLDSHEAVNLTRHRRTDRDPMWTEAGVLFASDRDGRLNLYRLDPASRDVTRLTHYHDDDVRWPSADEKGRVVYELNGELVVLDTVHESPEPQRLHIMVHDDGLHRRPQTIGVAGMIEGFELSPGGERVLFVARGDLFSAPVDHGVVRNLTRSCSAHEREGSWSPDGRRIAFISDATGEEEIWLVDQGGATPSRQLTSGNRTRFYNPVWSGNGEWLAVSDSEGRIWTVEVSSGTLTKVGDSGAWYLRDYSWSPDSEYLAYAALEPSFFRSLNIWQRRTGVSHRITDERFDEYEPVWDPDGRYLYFLSVREFDPQLGRFEWNYSVNRAVGIYAYALRNDVLHPFPHQNREVACGPVNESSADASGDRETEASTGRTEIELEGLSRRVLRVPLLADNYDSLTVTRSHILYRRNSAPFYGRADSTHELMAFSIADRQQKSLARDVKRHAVSRDGTKVLVALAGTPSRSFELIDVESGTSSPVSTTDLRARRIPAQEWETVFDEVWRRFRDFFYVENMHGFDWEALRERYRPLLRHVAHRSDLNYVISEMIAELDVSHAYISGGDEGLPKRPRTGLLGARFELDEAAGRYRIAEIFAGQNEEERYRSPLTEVGTGVAEGDYVLAVNGEPLRADMNPYALLRGTAGSLVELSVSRIPATDSPKSVLIRTLETERDLLYLSWVLQNQRRVAEATNGRVGYLHIPDMEADGIREFIKWYYGQVRRQGLIVDVRGNLGGNASQMILERLTRPLLSTGYVRGERNVRTYPWGRAGSVVFTGPMAVLVNENTMSDGDAFAWSFRQMGRGPLIGKRTWGGVVGTGNSGPLLDGGSVSVPQFGFADADGRWIIEGWGVEPDIEVENVPAQLIAGRDSQLERAIEEVVKALAVQPGTLPAQSPDPVRTSILNLGKPEG